VARHAFAAYRGGRVATVEQWLARFREPELLGRHPPITALAAVLAALGGRSSDATVLVETLERTGGNHVMPDGSPPEAWLAVVRAILCRHGVERMHADGEEARRLLSPASPFRVTVALLVGVSELLAGDRDRAEPLLWDALQLASSQQAVGVGLIAAAELALVALERSDLSTAQLRLDDGWSFVQPELVADYPYGALLLAADARVGLARGDVAAARERLAAAHRLRPQLTAALSWVSVQARLELARVHLGLADPAGARTLLAEAEEICRVVPSLGSLELQLDDARDLLRSASAPDAGWATALTAAELRLLPLLTTHLSFAEIAERLFVSRNTVKTQAISIYRKLDVSSRSDAIARARELGLVDGAAAMPVRYG
jgi:LuxR family maltose regulon positive regulatory protein